MGMTKRENKIPDEVKEELRRVQVKYKKAVE